MSADDDPENNLAWLNFLLDQMWDYAEEAVNDNLTKEILPQVTIASCGAKTASSKVCFDFL